MKLQEMRERMSALSPELEGLTTKLKDGELTDVESARIDAILNEINDLGPQIERAVAVEQAAGRAHKLVSER